MKVIMVILILFNWYSKNYDTNKKESLFINDFLYESFDLISNKGFKSDYKFLLKTLIHTLKILQNINTKKII